MPTSDSGPSRFPTADEVAKTIGTSRRGSVPRWMKLFVPILGVALALLGSGFAYSRAIKPRPIRYETAQVSRGRLEVTVSATGTLSAVGVVEVGSEVSGKVQKVYVSDNARVTKGQILAEIDPMQLASDVAQTSAQVGASKATIAQAEATATEAHLARERAEEQAKLGLIATKDLETARASDARAQASVASTKANLLLTSTAAATARWKLGRAKIVAPIDGVVLARLVEPGQVVVAAFQTPVLFRIASDLVQLELDVDIDEADVGRTREGQTATFQVDAWPDRRFPSIVKNISNEPKSTNGVVTYTAKLSVDNQTLVLRPGMTASATVITDVRENALLVPSSAFRFSPPTLGGSHGPPAPPLLGTPAAPVATSAPTPRDPHNKLVWIVSPSGQLDPVEVRPEASDGEKTAVTGNLQPGTQIALDILEGA